MKKVSLVLYFIFIILIVFAGCKKECDREETSFAAESGTEIMSTETGALPADKAFADARLFSYSGAYTEDGSDDEVCDIAALSFTNETGNFYQTLTLGVSDGENEYEFFITSLKPGAHITVLERSKAPFAGEERSVSVCVKESSFFDTIPEMYADKFAIHTLDGVMNLQNISDRDITGNVYVYYKNKNADGFFGGITYRVNFGALAAGELSQRGSSHLSAENSEILFITYDE